MIIEFRGEHSFLSNFTPVVIQYMGRTYASVEHAYMSAKSDDPMWKDYCSNPNISASDAKREGKKVGLISHWEIRKYRVMEDCLRLKFNQEPFRSMLIATGDQNIQEGNRWGDRVWGVDLKENPNVGENHLGRLLMMIREELMTYKKNESPHINKKDEPEAGVMSGVFS